MKLNTFGKIGLIIGLLGGVAGMVAAIATSPGEGTIISLIFVSVFFSIYWFFIRPIITSNRLMKTGEQREGKILKVWDTGVTINNDPQIGLLLEVKDRYGKPYEVKTKMLVSRLQVGDIKAGLAVTVRVDPRNDQKVAIEALGVGSPQNYSQQDYEHQMQKVLEAIEKENNEILQIGISAEAKVIQYYDLNVKVNGNNPFVMLLVEVQPGLKEPFYTDVKGVVGEQAISKFQPGEMITVKYDPNNHNRVTVLNS